MRKRHPLNKHWHFQRNAARRRRIPFVLSFDEWLSEWEQSGHISDKGRDPDQYCMARYHDNGPYALGNVKIITNKENNKEQPRKFGPKHNAEQRAAISRRMMGNKNGAARWSRRSAHMESKPNV